MRPEAAAQQLEREIQAQRRSVLSEALGLLRRMGRDELLATVSETLSASGFERIAPVSDLAGAPACAAELPVGASRLTTLVSIRVGAGVVDEETLETFREAGMEYACVGTGLNEGHAPARHVYEKCGFEPLIEYVMYSQKL